MTSNPTWADNLIHMRWFTKCRAYDYASAEAWIKGGRGHDVSRPTYTAGTRLVRRSANSIAVVVNDWLYFPQNGWSPRTFDLITYFADGTVVLDAQGALLGQGNRGLIPRFVPGVQVFRRKHRLVIRRPIDGLSPAKIQRCRSCRGTGLEDNYCYAVRYYCNCEQSEAPGHAHPCEHGETKSHKHGKRDCWTCKGAGKKDYGSKPTGLVWDGNPVAITPDYQFQEM